MQGEFIDIQNESKIKTIKDFLQSFSLGYENFDSTFVMYDDVKIIATCSKFRNLIKCIAVDSVYQNLNMLNLLLTNMIKKIYQENYNEVLVITTKENKSKFIDLGFNNIYGNNKICFLTNNFQKYIDYKKYIDENLSKISSDFGVILMNCNPFTKGHEFLIDKAREIFENVFVIPVKEEESLFSYEERKEMIIENIKTKKGIHFLDGTEYLISKSIFPSYFLKSSDQVIKEQTEMDINIFADLFENSKNKITRLVGSEPFSKTTFIYNETMKRVLTERAYKVLEMERTKLNGIEISASEVRRRIYEKKIYDDLVPVSTLKIIKKIDIYDRAKKNKNLVYKNN